MKFFTHLLLASLLLFFTFSQIQATELPDKQILHQNTWGNNIGGNNTGGNNYKFSEKQVRNKIEKTISNKFGDIKKYSLELIWPFRTQEQVDAIRLTNNELREIRNIAEENIRSENNYKKIMVRKAFVKYMIQMVKKPVKKVKVEWKEFEKQVPVTDFKDVERKRYDKQKLKQGIYTNTIEFISKKTYDYAFEKTKNKALATAIQKGLTKELTEKIRLKNVCLDDFLGKNREAKIDLIIEQLAKK